MRAESTTSLRLPDRVSTCVNSACTSTLSVSDPPPEDVHLPVFVHLDLDLVLDERLETLHLGPYLYTPTGSCGT